jgi:hypothetical protein
MAQEPSQPGTGGARAADPVERREAPRFPSDLEAWGQTWGPSGGKGWVAPVTDLSADGIALYFKYRVRPGTALVLTLHSQNRRLLRPLSVRVAHSTLQDNGDWVLGCHFVRKLSSEDLQSLS